MDHTLFKEENLRGHFLYPEKKQKYGRHHYLHFEKNKNNAS
jgi:hypothetical protein